MTLIRLGIVAALAALIAHGSPLAASSYDRQIHAVIGNLDLTSFPNSVGPRREPGKTTFADYGFVDLETIANGASLTQEDKGWMMSFTILSAGPSGLRLCFHDRGLARPGDVIGPSYNTWSALFVSTARRGLWTARQIPGGYAGCRNDPPDS